MQFLRRRLRDRGPPLLRCNGADRPQEGAKSPEDHKTGSECEAEAANKWRDQVDGFNRVRVRQPDDQVGAIGGHDQDGRNGGHRDLGGDETWARHQDQARQRTKTRLPGRELEGNRPDCCGRVRDTRGDEQLRDLSRQQNG